MAPRMPSEPRLEFRWSPATSPTSRGVRVARLTCVRYTPTMNSPLARSDTPGRDPAWLGKLQALLLLTYLGYYAFLAFGLPIESVVNGTVDDSYYYLVVARNIAAGLGSTFDGTGELTNGYHPLWMGFLVPLHLVVHDPELGIRLTLALSGLLALAMLTLLMRTLNRTVGRWAGLTTLIVFAWPRFFGLTQNALETALLLFVYAWVFHVFLQGRFTTTAGRVGLGLLLGFAMLARLDTVFLIFAVGIWSLLEWSRGGSLWDAFSEPSRRMGPLGSSAPVAKSLGAHSGSALSRLLSHLPILIVAIPVLPYLFWNLSVFGHLQPVSGAMKTTFPSVGFHPEPFRDFPEYAALLLVAFIAAFVGLRSRASRYARALAVFSIAALAHALYTVLFMIWAVDRWHFALLVFIALIALPGLGQWVLERFRRPISAAIVGLALAGGVVVQYYSLSLRNGRYQADTYEVARWAREHLPEDAVLSATDSGVIAYFSGLSTVNLDGLINSFDYLEHLREGEGAVEEYMRAKGVGYILHQNSFGLPDVISGNYEGRILRIAYRPEGRVSAEILVSPELEVHRRVRDARRYLGSPKLEPNAIILYRFEH